MIKEEKNIFVECDKCGFCLVHTTNCENVRFSSLREVEINAEEQNWTIKGDEHYCPGCQEELEQERVNE